MGDWRALTRLFGGLQGYDNESFDFTPKNIEDVFRFHQLGLEERKQNGNKALDEIMQTKFRKTADWPPKVKGVIKKFYRIEDESRR